MFNLKKTFATLTAAALLTTGTVSIASAGGIFDCIKSLASTAVSGLETAGNAIYGAGKYVFTDADGEESFADMKKSASETGDHFIQMGENAIKAGQDIMNFQMSSFEMLAGAVATGGAAAIEGVSNLVTGNDDYSWTKAASGVLKDGYDRYDAGFDTAADIASMAGGPIGTAVVNGIKVAKTAGEAAVGYKDRTWDDVGEVAKNAAVDTVISAVSGGLGTAAGKAASESAAGIVETVVSSATETAANVAVDLTDPENDRSVVDTVLEDVVNGAIGAGIGSGVDAAAGK